MLGIFSFPAKFPYFNIPLPVLASGHLSASRGVWDDHSYWGHHREPVLPGQQRAAESVQGSGAGKVVGGSDGLDPASGCRLPRTAGVEWGCSGTGLFGDLLRVSVSCALVITAYHPKQRWLFHPP